MIMYLIPASPKFYSRSILLLFLLVISTIPELSTAAENIALEKQTYASSQISSAAFAVDGVHATRWESAHNIEPSWIVVDLGAVSTIEQLLIDWESANPAIYEVHGSNDNLQWDLLSQHSAGVFGERRDTINIAVSYRYLKVMAIKRSEGNHWGFSIREIQVLGEIGTPNPGLPGEQNLAIGKYTFASSELHSASGATDGEMGTRWESQHQISPSWITVDLESQSTLKKMVIHWEAANAKNYTVQGSNDNQNWTSLTQYTDGVFGSRTDMLDISGDYRYVRILGTELSDNNGYGYSIFEIEIWGSSSEPDPEPETPTDPQDPVTDKPIDPDYPIPDYTPLFAIDTEVIEQTQYTEPDGTLVTLMGARPTERHARERGEAWDEPDSGPGRYLTFPPFYFQNRTFGLEIRDNIPAGGDKVEFWLHVNQGSFYGTTFSLFRNILDPNVRDFGWSLNYGFNNAFEGDQPLCHSVRRECMMNITANWRTAPHSPLKIGDKIELAPAPRLLAPVTDGGGERYYSFEQLYVVGEGLSPWYGIEPNLDSEPLPEHTLLGGDTSISYNYSEEPHRMFQQMANNIGIENTQRFVEGRRLFHTSFISGIHSEFPDQNPVFAAHTGQIDGRYNEERCIGCHIQNGRSKTAVIGEPLNTYAILTRQADGNPDPVYGLNIQQLSTDAVESQTVVVSGYQTRIHQFPDGEQVQLHTPVYQFSGNTPAAYSVRQAPQVIGMGLLEAVPESTILARQDPNDVNGDGIRGVAHWINDPETGETRLGRFGWKASKSSMRHQVSEALLLDMGITSPVFQSIDCQKSPAPCNTTSSEIDVSETELERLTQYLSLLGVPAQRSLTSGYPEGIRVSPEHSVDTSLIEQGRAIFEQMECSACHLPTLQTGENHPLAELRSQTIHPYTDLLLHDMGPGLADSIEEGAITSSMWRTPPLWGLGSLTYVQGEDGNPGKVSYLHDGRAKSLDEAILWHGGEANSSKNHYESLTPEERSTVKAFLNSL
ncbi:di-heme oxidoredictase family protein [Microbulbifer sp. ZKSA006]|uniref:di-heme oxidoredictase family protein n=1 Tax=Microbulbifer sp. ZKSA006 TaxID=3243390 RepID=UPI0040394789